MLPQEKFAFKYLYEGNFLGILKVSSEKDIENLMKDCNLKLRKNKTIQDLKEAFWGFGVMFHKNIDCHIEWGLNRADKVFTIDWSTLRL